MKRLLLVVFCALWSSVPAVAQTSRCADCHLANNSDPRLSAVAREHIDSWTSSVHARNNVGCDACHAGDATTFDPLRAHRGVLGPGHPASPVHAVNLPGTCGKCHTGPFVSFQRSRHYRLLRATDNRGPTCSTCHGDVTARLFSPASVVRQCNQCHGADGIRPRPDYGPDAGVLIKELRNVSSDLRQAKLFIDLNRDRSTRADLLEQYRQAEAPYLEAHDATHRFVFDVSRERMEVARERSRMLLLRLAERVTASAETRENREAPKARRAR